ncbi:MAG: hypothetical protein WCK26_00720 [Candidatus Saccharibacteria bacterium]
MIWLLAIFAVIVFIFGVVVFRGSPYVPSQKSYLSNAFQELYPIRKKDVLVDIGSGDGLVLREVAKFGAHAVGYEINPILVLISRIICYKNKNIKVVFADFWLVGLPDNTTVLYVFSVSRDINKLIILIQKQTNKLNRPLYVISYGSKFNGMKFTNKVGPHYLYKFYPLQPNQAQV